MAGNSSSRRNLVISLDRYPCARTCREAGWPGQRLIDLAESGHQAKGTITSATSPPAGNPDCRKMSVIALVSLAVPSMATWRV